VTNITKDHTDGLGDWAVSVASEKAGIIKPESLAVIGEVDDDLWKVFAAEPARDHWRRGRDFELIDDRPAVGGRYLAIEGHDGRYDDIYLSLHGAHQAANATLAVVAVEGFFGRALDAELVASSLAEVTVPGRFEIVGRSPLLVLDGAHNAAGADCLRMTLDEVGAGGRRLFVIGLLEPREPVEFLRALGIGFDDTVLTCAPDSPRAIDPGTLAAAAASLGAAARPAHSVAEALDLALGEATPDDLVLVTGSVLVAGEARSAARR
jgi:dihydrofolate synthase/folylpolyglutamate synthase